MAVTTVERTRAGDGLVAAAAWATIAGALLQIALGSLLAGQQDAAAPLFGLVAALNAISHLLVLAGVIGLARAGVAGRGALAVTGLGVTMLGWAVLVLAEVVWLSGAPPDALYGLATLALGLGPILAGVAVMRAGRWDNWRRFTLLACGLYVPLALLPSMALPGLAMNYAIGLWGVCWLLLGLALRAE
ncbi:MAG: hypothetical protein IT340_21685 [Chloroflexi bacterium]|nr:hypothetical protein [Chloroflexota bacterium]